MTKQNQIYKCEICGNITEVLHAGAGELVCCGEAMVLQSEKIADDTGLEKHLPVVEKLQDNSSGNIKVKVGKVIHPMEENHYIEWIEIMTINGEVFRKFLKPEDNPLVEFQIKSEIKMVRSYCNVHGLWSVVL